MKKIIIIILAVLFTVPVFAQTNKDFKKNQFLFSLTEFTVSTFKVGYVREFEKNAIDFSLGFKYTDGDGYNSYNNDEQTLNAELKYRIDIFDFYKKQSRYKLYFAPYAQYKRYNVRSYTYDWLTGFSTPIYDAGDAFGGGIVAGSSWIISKRLILNVYFGGGFRYASNVNNVELNSIFDATYKGIVPKAGIDIGFTF